MANTHRLRSTLAFIEANPDLWDQTSWLHCFAAIAVEGAGFPVRPSLWVWLPHRRLKVWERLKVWDAATQVLNLTAEQARALFAPDLTLPELRALVARLAPARPSRSYAARHGRGLHLAE